MDKRRSTVFDASLRFKRGNDPVYNQGQGRVISQVNLPENMNGVYSTRFSPDGMIIAVACGSGSIQVRNGETGELLETLRAGYEQSLPVMCARFGPKKLALGGKKEKKRVVEKQRDISSPTSPSPASMKPMKSDMMTFSESEEEEDDFSTVDFSSGRTKTPAGGTTGAHRKDRAQGTFFAGSACGRIFKCILNEGVCESFNREEDNEVHAVDVDISSTILASGGRDAILRLYDITTSKLIHSYERPVEGEYKGHNSRVFSVRFDPSEKNTVISGGWDDIVKIWDIRTPSGVTHNLYGPHICGSDAIDIQSYYLLTGSWSATNAIKVWELRGMKVLEELHPNNRRTKIEGEFVYAVHFFNGDPTFDLILVGGSGTGALEIISRNKNQVVANFPAEKAILSIDSIGSVITFGGMNNKVTIGEYT